MCVKRFENDRIWSEIPNLGRLQLKLQFVCNKGDEFRIRGFPGNVVILSERERVEGSSH